jgi:small subunit ribosomal protein S20
MANTKSAIKSIKKAARKSSINRSRKSRFKKAIKKMNTILEEKNKKEALTYLPKLSSELMKIAKTGIIKKENAARNISRITKKINSI